MAFSLDDMELLGHTYGPNPEPMPAKVPSEALESDEDEADFAFASYDDDDDGEDPSASPDLDDERDDTLHRIFGDDFEDRPILEDAPSINPLDRIGRPIEVPQVETWRNEPEPDFNIPAIRHRDEDEDFGVDFDAAQTKTLLQDNTWDGGSSVKRVSALTCAAITAILSLASMWH